MIYFIQEGPIFFIYSTEDKEVNFSLKFRAVKLS